MNIKNKELKKAIDTNSLWENLVQLTDNLDDYSIFHQVIDRNEKENTMVFHLCMGVQYPARGARRGFLRYIPSNKGNSFVFPPYHH